MKPGFVAGAMVAAIALALAIPSLRPSGLLRDFSAFYCAGQSLRYGADPYRAEPLGSCERAPKPAPLQTTSKGLAMPAPLPPFALLPFVALGGLPYVAAAMLWTLLGIGAVALTVYAMRRLTGLPLGPLIVAFAVTDGYASLALGQVAPFAIAAVALAARLIDEGRAVPAVLVAALALIEPHVGLPACLSLFVFRAPARLPLLALGLAFAAASLAIAGSATCLEYVRTVLPAHALSEIANEKQFSLTYALHRLGANDGLALLGGNLSYLVMVAAGIVAAARARKRLGPAAIVAIPAAFAVIGGPFVHISQLAAATPAALLIVARGTPRSARAAALALALLAVPWIQFANLGLILMPLAAASFALLVLAFVDSRPIAGWLAAAAAIVWIAASIGLVRSVPDISTTMLAHYDPRALAEQSWQRYVRTVGAINAGAFDFAKLPSVAGLLALAYATIVEAFADREPVPASVAVGGKGGAVPRRTTRA